MNFVEKTPLPISGLLLASISLAKLLGNFSSVLFYIFLSIAVLLLFLIVLKFLFYPRSVLEDFNNVVVLSSFGTFSMALMLFATLLPCYFNLVLWFCGLFLHIFIIILFSYRFVFKSFSFENLYLSYWIVYVGITMGVITGGVHGFALVDLVLFSFGFVSMLITLPLITYRYIKYPNVPDMFKPLVCIYTALFSILIVGYSSLRSFSLSLLVLIFVLSCVFYVFAFYKFLSFKSLDFYPSFSAFTFPFVISATATFTVSNILNNNFLFYLALFEIFIAVFLVSFVLFKYFKFYFLQD